VYSSDIQWVPQGEQEERYTAKPPAPVHADILLAKLQPGQRIAVEMHAVKGVGKDHAKFSPVATASYRLLPAVQLLEPVYDDDAEELAARSKVFDAVPCTDGSGHKLQAVASRPRLCNMSREILRDPKFAEKVHISRVNDHFICEYFRLCSHSCLSNRCPA
jgi:DNA-directed RNA polymerase I and III subunit RPAC1